MSLVPQFGFFELMVVAVIALVVVGPKDLPKMMRMAGRAFGHARRMASEFTAAFDQMARETEMEEMRKEIESLKRDNAFTEAKRSVEDAVKPIEKSVREEANEVRDAVNRPASEKEDSASSSAPDKERAE